MTTGGARLLGLAGWSGSGKTALLTRLIPHLAARGLRIATLKHAHHDFEVDLPGKDSYEHRKAGATEVIVSSARRWVQMHELGAGPEATLAQLLRRLSPCDLVLVEGFKAQPHPKMEVFRAALGQPPLHPHDKHMVAIASDRPFPDTHLPVADYHNTAAVGEVVLTHAQPLEKVLAMLAGAGHAA
jgi:molybdopterin-guanine dinucleotide biosynthesis protein B